MKKATTLDVQIDTLKKRGVVISDDEKAKENLLDIGYFRLGFYCFPFEEKYPKKSGRDHIYRTGTDFDNIVKLYYFDVDLRNLLSRYIYRIEINLRTYITYTVSNKYVDSPTWFVDPSIVVKTSRFHKSFRKMIYENLKENNSIIKNHHQKYINDKYAPAWKTLEFMTFGNIIALYDSLKDINIKLDIAKHYGFVSTHVFLNYLNTIRKIRNECAHSGVLFDLSLSKSISKGPAGVLGSNKNNLQGAIHVIRYMLGRVSKNRLEDLDNQLNQLTKNCCEALKPIVSASSGISI